VGGTYDAAVGLYDHFRKISGIGPAKASKLLHLKRPAFTPILDQITLAAYRERAQRAARQSARFEVKTMYWAAIRSDLLANGKALASLRAAIGSDDDTHLRRVADLTDLRIVDIIVWSRFRGLA
jgi:hypothetical protein